MADPRDPRTTDIPCCHRGAACTVRHRPDPPQTLLRMRTHVSGIVEADFFGEMLALVLAQNWGRTAGRGPGGTREAWEITT